MAESYSFKLYFLKQGSEETDFIKRVRVASPPSLKAFKQILASLFPNMKNPSFHTIKWKDEEGDMILVGSQPEWAEALACCPAWPFKLYLRYGEVCEPRPSKDQCNYEEEDEEEEEIPAFTVIPEGFYSERGDEEPTIDEQRHLSESVPEIITQIAGESGSLPGWLMSSIDAKQSGGDVLLDVNIPRFSLALHSQALSLLGPLRADLDMTQEEMNREAVKLLRYCVRLTPGDRNAHFNLACAFSRLEETEAALPPLERYIALGGDVQNIYADNDLCNVRKCPCFVWFEKANPNPRSSSSEASSPVIAEKEEPSSPEQPSPSASSSEGDEDKLKMLSEFGIDEAMGRLLLEDCDGDVDVIMAAQFQSQFL